MPGRSLISLTSTIFCFLRVSAARFCSRTGSDRNPEFCRPAARNWDRSPRDPAGRIGKLQRVNKWNDAVIFAFGIDQAHLARANLLFILGLPSSGRSALHWTANGCSPRTGQTILAKRMHSAFEPNLQSERAKRGQNFSRFRRKSICRPRFRRKSRIVSLAPGPAVKLTSCRQAPDSRSRRAFRRSLRDRRPRQRRTAAGSGLAIRESWRSRRALPQAGQAVSHRANERFEFMRAIGAGIGVDWHGVSRAARYQLDIASCAPLRKTVASSVKCVIETIKAKRRVSQLGIWHYS